MQPFKALYTPNTYDPETKEWRADADQARRVLVLAIVATSYDEWERAIFIDADGKLGSGNINHFTECSLRGG